MGSSYANVLCYNGCHLLGITTACVLSRFQVKHTVIFFNIVEICDHSLLSFLLMLLNVTMY